jgi:hypothetical protein
MFIESLKTQARALSDKAALITKSAEYLKIIVENLSEGHPIKWDVIAKTIQALQAQTNSAKTWYEQYLTVDENKELEKVIKKRTDQWLKLFTEVKNNLHTKPTSPFAKKIITKFLSLADKAYGAQPNLMIKLWEGYKAGIIQEDFFPRDQAIITYLSKAFEHFKQNIHRERHDDLLKNK